MDGQQEWFTVLAKNISISMRKYNTHFLSRKGDDWQRRCATEWTTARLDEDVYDLYTRRVDVQKTYAERKGDSIPILTSLASYYTSAFLRR